MFLRCFSLHAFLFFCHILRFFLLATVRARFLFAKFCARSLSSATSCARFCSSAICCARLCFFAVSCRRYFSSSASKARTRPLFSLSWAWRSLSVLAASCPCCPEPFSYFPPSLPPPLPACGGFHQQSIAPLTFSVTGASLCLRSFSRASSRAAASGLRITSCSASTRNRKRKESSSPVRNLIIY